MDWISVVNSAWSMLLEVLTNWNVDDFVKLLVLVVVIFIVVFGVATIWPLWRAYLIIYDITLLNRQAETHDYALLDASIDRQSLRCSKFRNILSLHCVHIQINPSWRGVLGSYTTHISVRRADGKSSAVIPVYNSGDIKRSRTFLIEKDGVREHSTSLVEVWPWSDDHHYGKTKVGQ